VVDFVVDGSGPGSSGSCVECLKRLINSLTENSPYRMNPTSHKQINPNGISFSFATSQPEKPTVKTGEDECHRDEIHEHDTAPRPRAFALGSDFRTICATDL
jgi:hypothetical protein